MFAKYAVNKTDSEIQMLDNKLCIVVNGWMGVTEEELRHPDILYALRKDWISLEEKEPKKPSKPAKPRLKTHNAQDPAFSGEKEPRAKVTKIGG